MSSPFLAEIRIFGFNFAPFGWAFCDGQLLPISQYSALFSLVGTNYGGNGTSTFGLPNMQGNAPMFFGQGLGLSDHVQGEASGTENVTVLQAEMPSHTHALMAEVVPANSKIPSNAEVVGRSSGGSAYLPVDSNLGTMAPTMVGVIGGNLPHNNMMPYLVLNFCIALQGIYPSRG